MIVTGFTPIPNHPRPREEYERLHAGLFNKIKVPGGSMCCYHTDLEGTWLYDYLSELSPSDGLVLHSVGDNPKKNTIAYHCVQHQKFEWLANAATKWEDGDPLVWIDYGIAHCEGVTPDVVNEFLTRVQPGDFAIPGCWDITPVNDDFPCWRFCGGLMVVPRDQVFALRDAVVEAVESLIRTKHNVSWEVNTLARIEPLLPIRWYAGDHNETMFTHYRRSPV